MTEDQIITTVTSSPHSIELSRNASGGVSFTIKVYGGDPAEALVEARDLFDLADAQWPVKEKGK